MAISDFIRSVQADRPDKKKKIHRTFFRRRLKGKAESVKAIVKTTAVPECVHTGVHSSNVHMVRLSDPDLEDDVKQLSKRLQSDPEYAMRLLRKAGIVTASGKLSERYGG